jgi:hypothetical protein
VEVIVVVEGSNLVVALEAKDLDMES